EHVSDLAVIQEIPRHFPMNIHNEINRMSCKVTGVSGLALTLFDKLLLSFWCPKPLGNPEVQRTHSQHLPCQPNQVGMNPFQVSLTSLTKPVHHSSPYIRPVRVEV